METLTYLIKSFKPFYLYKETVDSIVYAKFTKKRFIFYYPDFYITLENWLNIIKVYNQFSNKLIESQSIKLHWEKSIILSKVNSTKLVFEINTLDKNKISIYFIKSNWDTSYKISLTQSEFQILFENLEQLFMETN